jgi:hypothetical protein
MSVYDDDDDFLSEDENESYDYEDSYDEEDFEDGFSESDIQVDEVFDSLIEDLTYEQLEDLYNRIGDHLSK